MAKAAIQTLSELNPLAALDAKVSDEQEAEFTKLRLVPDTGPSAIYDQARPAFDNPGAGGNRKAEQKDITGRHIGGPVDRDRSSIAFLHVGAKTDTTQPDPPPPSRVRCVSQRQAHLTKGGRGQMIQLIS
ncbi:hypothetical protein HGE68_01195 [Rhodobacteraceae bacterium R_SAG6]|nr:hypothetical protein [Rhodobacteraceae bacterium R_SAG6]